MNDTNSHFHFCFRLTNMTATCSMSNMSDATTNASCGCDSNCCDSNCCDSNCCDSICCDLSCCGLSCCDVNYCDVKVAFLFISSYKTIYAQRPDRATSLFYKIMDITNVSVRKCQCPNWATSLFYVNVNKIVERIMAVSMPYSGDFPFLQSNRRS